MFDNLTIDKIRNNDEKEFERLFRFYYQSLINFSFRYLQDRQAAEDVVQNVFLLIWENRKKFDPKHTIRVYLYSAVKNQSLKVLRHLKIKRKYLFHQNFIETDTITPEDVLHQKDVEKSIYAAINDLPEKCREIFCMNRFDGLTYSEIAKIQQISLSTIETQMVRALKFLRKRLHII